MFPKKRKPEQGSTFLKHALSWQTSCRFRIYTVIFLASPPSHRCGGDDEESDKLATPKQRAEYWWFGVEMWRERHARACMLRTRVWKRTNRVARRGSCELVAPLLGLWTNRRACRGSCELVTLLPPFKPNEGPSRPTCEPRFPCTRAAFRSDTVKYPFHP